MNQDSEFEPLIGLEIHAQLQTKSKLFCSCSTSAIYQRDIAPNEHICPVCVGLPGILPRPINRKAVLLAVRAAYSLNSDIQTVSKFERKNYFYPDLPKGYQISQYRDPFAHRGWLEFELNGKIVRCDLIRIHIEEDAGKHITAGSNINIDFNRSGVPLIEIVTEPQFHSDLAAVAFLVELRRVLIHLDVCKGNMEMGNFRFDVNVSIRPIGSQNPGTRTEIKNLNSFSHLSLATKAEIDRQINDRRTGIPIKPVTLRWDEDEGNVIEMREKEGASDYRFIQEPDLLELHIDREINEEAINDLPELPLIRQKSYEGYKISPSQISQLLDERFIADYFDETVRVSKMPPPVVAKWFVNHVLKLLETAANDGAVDSLKLTPSFFADILSLVEQKKITNKSAIEVIEKILETGLNPIDIVKNQNLWSHDDNKEVEAIISTILQKEENKELIKRYQAGNVEVINILMGQVMKATKNLVGGNLARKILENFLKKA